MHHLRLHHLLLVHHHRRGLLMHHLRLHHVHLLWMTLYNMVLNHVMLLNHLHIGSYCLLFLLAAPVRNQTNEYKRNKYTQ